MPTIQLFIIHYTKFVPRVQSEKVAPKRLPLSALAVVAFSKSISSSPDLIHA